MCAQYATMLVPSMSGLSGRHVLRLIWPKPKYRIVRMNNVMLGSTRPMGWIAVRIALEVQG